MMVKNYMYNFVNRVYLFQGFTFLNLWNSSMG